MVRWPLATASEVAFEVCQAWITTSLDAVPSAATSSQPIMVLPCVLRIAATRRWKWLSSACFEARPWAFMKAWTWGWSNHTASLTSSPPAWK